MHVRIMVGLSMVLILTACSRSVPPQASAPLPSTPAPLVDSVAPTLTARAAPTAAPTTTPLPPPPTPTVATATSAATITPLPPTATPDPVAGLTIPDLRARRFGAGEISIGEVWQWGDGYTSYRISYDVDGLRLTGLLHVPAGAGPFPVIIANRGTIAREIYQPGMDSRDFADLMARHGYLVVAPDLPPSSVFSS